MKLRVGIVGCGRIGCGFDDDPKRKMISTHAGAYEKTKETQIVGLCDLDVNKLKKYGKKYKVFGLYTDYIEMLEKENLDILSICTWSSSHYDIIANSSRYDIKAIFCEKPLADNLKQGREIVNICNKEKIILQVDHQRRFDNFYKKIRIFLKKGNLGKIQQGNFYYTSGIANTGSHIFDLLLFFFGIPDWVQSNYSDTQSPNTKDPNIDGFVKFKNGILCSIQSCDVKNYLIFEMDIIGSRGRLKLTHSGFGLEYYIIKDSPYFSGYRELFRSRAPFSFNKKREFMLCAIKHLIYCIKNDIEPISSGIDGLASLELIIAFHESARKKGKKVYLPLKYSNIVIESR